MKLNTILVNYTNQDEYEIAGLDKKGDILHFDFSVSNKKPLKSSIFVAKVVKTENALQAAFVDYGGDKSGFLPFSEIHPDYYQIPEFDKQKIVAEIEQERLFNQSLNDHMNVQEDDAEKDFDVSKGYTFHRRYDIQEVIKKDQILLVQVTKEERGNKGVSLTTYLSLAGRYCVFMPNSANGIGVSRKINSLDERKRLLAAAKSCNLKNGTSLVIRTAGIGVSDADIRNDYRYLMNLWTNILNHSINAGKIGLVHREEEVLEQFIRDRFDSNHTHNILVNKKECYDRVLQYLKNLMPAESNKVSIFKDKIDLFTRYNVYDKVSCLFDAVVKLESGGSIVIEQTEAMTSIDVNSGRVTSEKDVESTALKINSEAAIEVARQIQLRGIGGLIVVDFIDMNDLGHKKEVEKITKQAFADDKSRVQFSRISHFGLMEISRQRLRPSIIEVFTKRCDCCEGNGRVKNLSFVGRAMLSKLEELLLKNVYCSNHIEMYSDRKVKNFLSSHYANVIQDIERRFQVKIHNMEYAVNDMSHFTIKTSDRKNQIINKYKSRLYYNSKEQDTNLNLIKKVTRFFVKLKRV